MVLFKCALTQTQCRRRGTEAQGREQVSVPYAVEPVSVVVTLLADTVPHKMRLESLERMGCLEGLSERAPGESGVPGCPPTTPKESPGRGSVTLPHASRQEGCPSISPGDSLSAGLHAGLPATSSRVHPSVGLGASYRRAWAVSALPGSAREVPVRRRCFSSSPALPLRGCVDW